MTTYTAPIRTTGRKVGYVRHPELDGSVEIDTRNLLNALNNDTVEFEVTGTNREGQLEGKVTKVVKRDKDVFVGQIKNVFDKEKNKREEKFVPDSRNFWPEVKLLNLQKFTKLDGQKFLIKLENWEDPKATPEFVIVDVIGKVGTHETEMRATVLDRGLVMGFPPEVEKAAQELKEKSAQMIQDDIPNRRDMRDTLMFTIDPFDAKDFDDALSLKKLDNGNFEVGIHIADPSFFVRPGTILDDEAVKRATSIYLVDRTIPMLPEVLSNHLCSLNANEEKLTFSAVFEMDRQGNVLDRWFGRTITISDRRFNYEEAQAIIDANEGDHVEELQIMSEMAKHMQKRNVAHGKIEFESTEVKFNLDEAKFPISVYEKKRVWTMEMIEEFMLLANKEVSRYVSVGPDGEDTGNPFIYRIHDKPKPEKITEAVNMLNKLGFEVESDGDGKITSKEINRILKAHKGEDIEKFISMTLLRSMRKAEYSTKNIGHFGLAFAHYSHFTSPIRRYPDMIAHRYLAKYLAGETVGKSDKAEIQELAIHSSEMEKKAVDAERASIKFKYVELFSTKIGEEIQGMVTGVTKFGIFVEDKETKAEGLINVRNMGGDFYKYDEKSLVLRGTNTGTVYRIGDSVIAKVKDVDIENRNIDFELVTKK